MNPKALPLFLSFVIASLFTDSGNAFPSWDIGQNNLVDNRPADWPADEDAWLYTFEPEKWRREQFAAALPVSGWVFPLQGIKLQDYIDIPEDCSRLVWKRFTVEQGFIGFTIGRSPETCGEAPYMIWNRVDGSVEGMARIVPFENMNVDNMWDAGEVIVFGLRADYELGGKSDKLVIWHLPSNQWFSFQIPESRIGLAIEEWLAAEVVWSENTMHLRANGKTLSLQPFKRIWQLQ